MTVLHARSVRPSVRNSVVGRGWGVLFNHRPDWVHLHVLSMSSGKLGLNAGERRYAGVGAPGLDRWSEPERPVGAGIASPQVSGHERQVRLPSLLTAGHRFGDMRLRFPAVLSLRARGCPGSASKTVWRSVLAVFGEWIDELRSDRRKVSSRGAMRSTAWRCHLAE